MLVCKMTQKSLNVILFYGLQNQEFWKFIAVESISQKNGGAEDDVTDEAITCKIR